jgi:hypothetical protein
MSENLVLMEIKEYKDLREFLGLQVKVATLDSPATRLKILSYADSEIISSLLLREILAGQEVRGPVEKMENQLIKLFTH